MTRSTLLLFLQCSIVATSLSGQISFTNQTDLLSPVNHFSGVAIAVLDMNGDGLDDVARLSQGTDLNIQFQSSANQAFLASSMTPLPGNDTWGICAADVDNDGLGDLLTGGQYNGVKIVRSNSNGSFQIQNITTPGIFVQAVNFADINNDGWLDAFVCHDDGVSKIFGNNGNGSFSHQPNWINLTTVPGSDNSGNYGSVWSDVNNDGHLDLYIAHCRQGINDPTDPRRINQLFLNNGNGTYSQDITNTSGLRIGAQSWTADFGDIDNDGDFDCFITNHDVSSQLLENDGSGHFSDITDASGLLNAVQGLPIQGVFRDFDNDGYVDIIVAGTTHYLFRNQGNKTFGTLTNPFGNNQIESFAIGDLNGDGFQDVYAGYAHIYTTPSTIPDALWINNGNNNHFYALSLRGQQSNRSGVGAKVQLYSALGIQTREVRAGESYGISNSLQIHFGMGQITTIDSVVVNWPSGIRDVLYQPAVDQFAILYEGNCVAPTVSVVADGPTTFCTGESVNLQLSDPFVNYLWNTGDTTAVLTVTDQGAYSVTITNNEGCTAISGLVFITVDPIQIPGIEALSDTVFCAGGSVVLTCTDATEYLWNTGATTQTITVSQSGSYQVAAKGLCNFFNSAQIQVNVLAPPLPIVFPDTILINETAMLLAEGDQISWYDSQTSSTLLGTSDTLWTPSLTENTTYWVSNTTLYGLPNDFVGMVNHEGSAMSDNNYNGGLIFDCFEPFTLAKTKVITNVGGERQIELRAQNGAVIASKIVDILSGTTIIDLGFEVPVGTDFLLTTNQTFNSSSLGSLGPQLRRSSLGCAFPYEIPGIVSIKNSTFNTERYYYFYDWEIAFDGYECTSDRVPVTVVVEDNSSVSPLPIWASGLRIFPNPTEAALSIEIQGYTGGELLNSVKNAQGQTLQVQRFRAPAGPAVFNIDLGDLPKGIYWLELATDSGLMQRKVLVH